MYKPNILLIFMGIALLATVNSQIDEPIPNTIDPTKYGSNVVVLNGGDLKYYFLVDEVKQEIEIAIECDCQGWFGWGITRSGTMLDTDVIISWFDNGTPVTYDYNIGDAYSADCASDGLCRDTQLGGTDDVLAFNGSITAAGLQQMIWRRKFDTGDALDVVIDPKNPEVKVIAGFNRNNPGPTIRQHSGTPVTSNVNLFTGAASTISKIDLILVHGGLMFVAWFISAPIGFVFARFLKNLSWWFHMHRGVMILAIVLMIIGFALAVKDTNSGHFNDAHKIIGLIIFILSIGQGVIGFLADRFFKPDRLFPPIWPDKIHWYLGYGTIILGLINILLGLVEYEGTATGVLVVYCIGAALLFIGVVAFSVFRLLKPVEDPHHNNSVPSKTS